MASDEDNRPNTTKDMIEAVTGLAEAVPIYQDLLQPAAQQIGKTLGTVAKSVNLALSPLTGLIWGYERIGEFIERKVSERLNGVQPEDIVTPKPNIAGPAIEALRFTGHESSLSDMYANLLASSMDRKTAELAHPAFVEIIKQLTPEEAKILELFRTNRAYPLITLRANHREIGQGGTDRVQNYSHLWKLCDDKSPNLYPSFIDNLCRLGILEIPSGLFLLADNTYEPLETDPLIVAEEVKIRELAESPNPSFIRKMMRVTPLGKQFVNACITSKIDSLPSGN